MLTDAGVDTYLYAHEQNEARCSELVPIVTTAQHEAWFGNFDFSATVFNDFEPYHPWWLSMNAAAIEALRQRVEPGDIVGLSMGLSHQPIAQALQGSGVFIVEQAIGYGGVFAPHRIYESHAWRHYIAGRDGADIVRFYDTVIPNYFEADAFPLGDGAGDYFCLVGRITENKGIRIAAETCNHIGAKLVVAGQGSIEAMNLPGDVEHVGLVDEDQRGALMQGAIAQFAPSLYLEPFCAASVEPQMCGTPVISTAWGALVENVTHGETGFLCDTLAQFCAAAEACKDLDRSAIRKRAQDRWSTDVLTQPHIDYFERVQSLVEDGWYTQ